MTASNQAHFVAVERERIQLEYERRAREISPDQYAPWQASARFMLDSRNRKAAAMLHSLDAFPKPGDQCLEVGFGALGWLSELISWGVREPDLFGLELDPSRARKAQRVLPVADLRIGDAVSLPWNDGKFKLAIASTLFTSVLDHNVRRLIANEIVRVLAPGGALLWYDFAYDNPSNANVQGIKRAEIKSLFPELQSAISSVTLAPPLTRLIAPRWWTLASLLESIPFLRTHLIAVLIKKHS